MAISNATDPLVLTGVSFLHDWVTMQEERDAESIHRYVDRGGVGAVGALVSKGTARARAIKRAHILLLADEGKDDPTIAAALHAD